MADYSPTWENIVGKWLEELKEATGFTAYSPYPENALDPLELPCIVVNEPTELDSAGLTFAALTLSYGGELSLFVSAVSTGQARLTTQNINAITALALKLQVAVMQRKSAKGFYTHAMIGPGKISRLSPYDADTRGHYAGVVFPYTIQMQYRSSL